MPGAMKRTFRNRGGRPWWYWRRVAARRKGVRVVDGLLVLNNRVLTLNNRVMRLSDGS